MSERELERILAEEPDEAKAWMAMEKYLNGGDHMTEQNLAQMCFEYRALNNLNQLEIGERCGLPRETINRVERGKKYSRMTETKIRMTIEGRK